MEKLLLDLKKTVEDFNRDNEGKGFKAKYTPLEQVLHQCFVPNNSYMHSRQSDQRQIYST